MTGRTHTSVLLVEDNPGDARLVQELLRDVASQRFDIVWVASLAAASEALDAQRFDVALLDLQLPDSVGLDTLQRIQTLEPSLPVVILSGARNEQLALEAVNAGAQDYLVKGQTDGGPVARALRYAIDRKRMRMELAEQVRRDALTGLPNRAALMDFLPDSMARARRRGEPLAVMFLDLDHFKAVNDSLGHDAGDAVLIEVSRRLVAGLRASDFCCRLGGDEFVVVLEVLSDPGHAEYVANKLITAVSAPIPLVSGSARVGLSAGVALGPLDDDTPEGVLRRADASLYAAKTAGRGRSSGGGPRRGAGRQLEEAVRAASASGRFAVHYQPIVDVSTGRAVGAEALLRLQDPVLGLVTAADLIPVLRRTGLLLPVGAWVVGEACAAAAATVPDAPLGTVAVNLSAEQLRSPQILDDIRGALERSGLAPNRLQLDVDGALLGHGEDTHRVLAKLRELGVRLALDDFGVGALSVANLVRLPVDLVKLDGSLVRGLDRDAEQRAVVEALVQVAHALGIIVVAESVEHAAEHDVLAGLGCEQAQGFLLGAPQGL